MRKFATILGLLALAVVVSISYQNCGEGFQPADSTANFSSNTDPANPSTPPPPAVIAGATNLDYEACYTASGTDAPAMTTCLNSKATVANVFDAATTQSCFTKVEGSTNRKLFLAMCLTANGKIIIDHRPPTQFDFESCYNKVGQAKVAGCFAKNGISTGINQAAVDACVGAAGIVGVEKCFRKRGLIPRKGFLYQADVDFCSRLTGGTTNLAWCLQNAEILPSTVTQAMLDGCIGAVGITSLAKCTRVMFYTPRVVMQAHINACIAAVGETKIAACLDKQGLLPVPAANLDAFQTEINDCLTKLPATEVVKCFRIKGFLSNEIMQPHVASCYDVKGADNVFACLEANFKVLPSTLNQIEISDCFTKNGGTAANAAKCLRTKNILTNVPNQIHISACARFAGETPDTTGEKPGQIGIYSCLVGNGFNIEGLSQEVINTCITNVGVANVETCLINKGILPAKM